jgi:hypothetical protein
MLTNEGFSALVESKVMPWLYQWNDDFVIIPCADNQGKN